MITDHLILSLKLRIHGAEMDNVTLTQQKTIRDLPRILLNNLMQEEKAELLVWQYGVSDICRPIHHVNDACMLAVQCVFQRRHYYIIMHGTVYR